MDFSKVVLLFFLLAVVSGISSVSAAEYSAIFTEKRDSVNAEAGGNLDLDEIVVTGTRSEKRLSEVPVLTAIIRRVEMQKSGTVSLLESLQDNIPGIVFSPNAMGNNMRIRGLNSRYVLFLVDGERMVSEGAGGNVNLDQVDLNSVEKIEIVNGASSVLYGSNAVGGVINIITRRPSSPFQASAGTSWETCNTLRSSISAASSLSRFNVYAGAFRNSSDGFGGASGDTGPYAAKYADYGANLKVGFNLSERFDMNLSGRYFRHETFNPENSMNRTHPLSHTMSVSFASSYRSHGGRNVLKLTGSFDKYFDLDLYEGGRNTELDNTTEILSVRITDNHGFSDRLEMVTGAEYNRQNVFSARTLGSVPASRHIDDLNAFVHAEYEPFKSFDITGGVRYTYNTQFHSAVTPTVSMMYVAGGFKFRGTAGTSYRAPDIKELYYDFDHQGMFWVYGNPDLRPEYGFYVSLSAEYSSGPFNASLTGYCNNISDKITQYDVINSSGGSEKYYENISSATLKGVDFNFSTLLFRHFMLKGNYSFCDARDNATGLQLSSNVRHSATVSLTWNGNIMKSPFSVQMAGRITSPKLYQSVTEDSDGVAIVEKNESKPYNIWKIIFSKPVRLGKDHSIDLSLKCDNIFNFREESFIDPGRKFLVGVRYTFR